MHRQLTFDTPDPSELPDFSFAKEFDRRFGDYADTAEDWQTADIVARYLHDTYTGENIVFIPNPEGEKGECDVLLGGYYVGSLFDKTYQEEYHFYIGALIREDIDTPVTSGIGGWDTFEEASEYLRANIMSRLLTRGSWRVRTGTEFNAT